MLLVQLTGLSGAGKTTLASRVADRLTALGYPVEVLDGDECRRHLWPELTFSDHDRRENNRRLAHLARRFTRHGIVVLMAAINPFERIRCDIKQTNPGSQLVFIDCDLPTLRQRDTKGLYARAELPADHPDKLTNLTGINAPYERPASPDLVIQTHLHTEDEATDQLLAFLVAQLQQQQTP